MKIVKIKLYGAIEAGTDNSAASFTKQLTEAQKVADVIELHLHCPGGDVFEGNVIYNAIKESTKPVDVYIDGMAASMASVIMLAGRKIYMAENAFIMIHAPHTFSCGNAEDLEKAAHLLRSIETNFIDAFCARTGKEKEAVAEWLQGDNWFNAKEASEEKLIDGIVGASDVKMGATQEDLKKTNATALLQRFEAITNTYYQPQNNNQMDKQSLIDKLGLTGVTAQSDDAAIEAAIQAKINAGDAKVAEMKTKQINAAIDAAIAAKKITEEKRALYQGIGEKSGIEALNEVLDGIKVQAPSITSQLTPKNSAEARADWDWEKWQKEDPRGLEALAETDHDKFQALYNARYKNA
jgi:ATP-dependent Clp endopeptidase proteolytic subunit ClpP